MEQDLPTTAECLTTDLASLLLCANAQDEAAVDAALRRLSPEIASPLDALARSEAVVIAIEGFPFLGGRFGNVQPDLAATALERAGVPVPGAATLAELDAEVLRAIGSVTGDPVVDLAAAVARLRARVISRAGKAGLVAKTPVLTRSAPPAPRQGVGSRIVASAVRAGGGAAGMAVDAFEAAARLAEKLPFMDQMRREAEEAQKRMGKVNVLIGGKSGSGKSTLVNAVFGAEVAETGSGRPVTQNVTWFEPPGLPVRLCDTRGLEMSGFEETLGAVEKEIERAASTGRGGDRVHVLWLCIQEPGARVEEGEERLAALCARHGIPVIVVLTKAIGPRNFQDKVREILPGSRGIVRVLAQDWDDRPAFGLVDLIGATDAVLPEAVKAAFDAAQQVEIGRKRKRALDISRTAAGAAAAAAATPIPVADAAAVFSVNVGMVAGIAAAMGVQMSQKNLAMLGASLLGALGAAAGGRLIAGGVLKLVPGLGSIVGGVLNSGVAASTTYGLGFGFTEYLCRFHAAQHRMPEGDELREGFRRFWASWDRKEQAPPTGS